MVKTLIDYNKERDNFFSSLSTSFWDKPFGEEYALLDAFQMSEEKIGKAKLATERIGFIFSKAIEFLREATDEELIEDLGIPKGSLEIIRMKPLSVDSVISRVDLVEVDGEFKTYEINADTPMFIKEVYEIGGLVCNYLGLTDANKDLIKQLELGVKTAITEACFSIGVNPDEAHVVFTSHSEEGDIEEDHTVLFVKEHSGFPNAGYTPLQELLIDEEGLYDHNDRKIDVLYRQTYPLEYLVDDVSPDGKSIGQMLLNLVKEGKLQIINPPSSFLMQSKAVQAFIWEAFEENIGLFTFEECRWIEKHFLPTYWSEKTFEEKKVKYVRKPAFGREGDTIDIIDPSVGLIHSELERTYSDSLPIYQAYQALPKAKVQTLKGVVDAHLLIGCFLIGNKASALGMRAATTQITNKLCYFLPVARI